MIQKPEDLEVGDRLYNGSTKGVVSLVVDSTVYISWDAGGEDTLAAGQFNSPLWAFLNVEPDR